MSISDANKYFKNGDYEKAIRLYRELLVTNTFMKDTILANIVLTQKRLCSLQTTNKLDTFQLSENVFVGIASIPERVNSLEKTINSLINQVDKIGVYLNNWHQIPNYLKNNNKIIIAGFGEKDIGDIGKFYWVDNHDGIYFTCDDDLLYPADYIKRTISKLKKYSYKAVIGWHGSLIKKPFKNYYETTSRRVFMFSSHRPKDTPVHILGTGCCAFHTQKFPIKIKDFLFPNMADIFFSIKGQQLDIPFYIMQHEKDEIVEISGNKEDSIFMHSIENKNSIKNTYKMQNELILSIPEWTTKNFNKMSILLIGRFENYSKGGIYKSCHIIQKCLTELGHKISIVDTQNNLDIKNRYDLCWIYPGDPDRPDFEFVDQKIKLLQEKKIPIIVNLSYLYNDDRTKWIAEKIKQYNKNSAIPVLAAVFTETAANDILLKEVKDFITVVPKTLSPAPSQFMPSFENREGICFGDATKLSNSKIIGGNIAPWIDAVHTKLPHVNLYAYKQYGGKNPHTKVTYVPYMDNNFGDWLSTKKLFICTNVHLTFEMVACEAQLYGTPIIYRHMPHSLSEYISATGFVVRSPEEMAEIVEWLYNDKRAWNNMSQSSYFNAESKHINLMRTSLEGYLRLAIFRTKELYKKNIQKGTLL